MTTHNTHNKQISHACGRFRTRNPKMRAVADPAISLVKHLCFKRTLFGIVLYSTVSKLWKFHVWYCELTISPIIFELSWLVPMDRDEMTRLETRLPPHFSNIADHPQLSQFSVPLNEDEWLWNLLSEIIWWILCFRKYKLPCFLLFWCHFVIFFYRHLVIHLDQTGIAHCIWIPMFVTVLSASVNHEHRNWTSLYCVTRTDNVLNWTPTYMPVKHRQIVGNQSTWYCVVK